MKNSAWYNRLWQNKMDELPVEGDANTAWKKMQGLLDQHLPVESPAPVSGAFKTWWSRFMIIAGAVIIGAVAYYFATRTPTINNVENDKHHMQAVKMIKNNSGKNKVQTDRLSSLKQNNSADMAIKPPVVNAKHATVDQKDNALSTPSSTLKNKAINEHASASGGASLALKQTANNSSQKTGVNNLTGVSHHLSSGRLVNNKGRQNSRVASVFVNPLDKDATIQQKTANDLGNPVNAPLSKTTNPVQGPGQVSSAANANKPDSSALMKQDLSKPGAQQTGAPKTAQTLVKSTKQKSKAVKKESNSNFELGIKLGVNTSGSFTSSAQNKNFYGKSSVDGFVGVNGTYYISPSFGVAASIHILTPKVVSATYLNTAFVTLDDTGKQTIHAAGKLAITSSRKIYTVDVPVNLVYRASNLISFRAGPVISFPVKQGSVKSSLNRVTNPLDTVNSTALINSAITSTTIDNKIKFSFSAGAVVHLKRFYFDADYMQNITPYKLSSPLGNTTIYYHTIQFGVGYILFKPKAKP